MKAFALVNGDLAVDAGGYRTVTGATKLRQDLGVAVREPFGCDRFHPRWGSLLPEYIGRSIDSEASTLVRSEVSRVIQNYIAVQRDARQQTALQGTSSRYGTGEIIDKVNAIEVVQDFDRLHVRVALTTVAQDDVVLVSTVRG